MSNTNEEPSYIHHHLGLGDHIICNGLVRSIQSKGSQKVVLVVKESNINNVARMYRDCEWIEYYSVKTDEDFYEYHKNNPQIKLLRVGFDGVLNSEFDRSFYESVGVCFKERWDSWYLHRDFDQENLIKKDLNIDSVYIFVHDESSLGKYELNIESDLRQIKPRKMECEKSIFDWLGVIEDAKEIHCINSSFIHMVDSFEFTNKKFYHTIKKPVGFSLKNDWGLVNYD